MSKRRQPGSSRREARALTRMPVRNFSSISGRTSSVTRTVYTSCTASDRDRVVEHLVPDTARRGEGTQLGDRPLWKHGPVEAAGRLGAVLDLPGVEDLCDVPGERHGLGHGDEVVDAAVE